MDAIIGILTMLRLTSILPERSLYTCLGSLICVIATQETPPDGLALVTSRAYIYPFRTTYICILLKAAA